VAQTSAARETLPPAAPVRRPEGPRGNGVLANLSPEAFARLQPYVEPLALESGAVLYDAGDTPRYAVFPTAGLLSLLATTDEGGVLQVATIGRDGFAGLPIVLGGRATSQVMVQAPVTGYRLRAEIVAREFQRAGTFHRAALRHLERVLAESAQGLICHRYHSVRQRLCRWLLATRDAVGSDTLTVTQEQIALLLGMPRSTVSLTATAFQDRGLLRQRHGRLEILRGGVLEVLACECYHLLRPAGAAATASPASPPSTVPRSRDRPVGEGARRVRDLPATHR
jgi:CRP-like cAMP-binding protein